MNPQPSGGRVTIPNIGPRGRRVRRISGLVMLALAAALGAALFGFGVPRAWRVVLFAPLWVSALGFLQAREKT